MKIHSVKFTSEVYKLGTGSNVETRAKFVTQEKGAPDPLGRPIPPKPSIDIYLVLGGNFVLVKDSNGQALMVPRERIEQIELLGKPVDGKWIVPANDMKALCST